MPRIFVVVKLDSSINKQFCIISAGFLFCNAKEKVDRKSRMRQKGQLNRKVRDTHYWNSHFVWISEKISTHMNKNIF